MDALRDEFVKELNLLGEREDIVAVGGTEAKDGQNDKGERSKRGTTTAAASAVIGAKGKKPKSAKQLKYAKPVKIDEVCWIKRECGHVVIKVCVSCTTLSTPILLFLLFIPIILIIITIIIRNSKGKANFSYIKNPTSMTHPVPD